MVKMLNFKIIIERDEDGLFIGSVPAVPGCFSQGKTYEELIKNIKEALELSLDFAKKNRAYSAKIHFPEEKKQTDFVKVIDLPIKFAC
ncbi:type II toxin-antitoxin system HicB family antitoxin [Candidatus Roizmanbacteria bacterium]|nr:type II toxin-antitoxin system HicB family antitoxin [Candidatus Roizmanbacteria bacterium]